MEEFGTIKRADHLSATPDLTLAVNGRELCPGKLAQLSEMLNYPGDKFCEAHCTQM